MLVLVAVTTTLMKAFDAVNHRIFAEPGGVASLAALLSGAYSPQLRERVGVIICGGNTAAVPERNLP